MTCLSREEARKGVKRKAEWDAENREAQRRRLQQASAEELNTLAEEAAEMARAKKCLDESVDKYLKKAHLSSGPGPSQEEAEVAGAGPASAPSRTASVAVEVDLPRQPVPPVKPAQLLREDEPAEVDVPGQPVQELRTTPGLRRPGSEAAEAERERLAAEAREQAAEAERERLAAEARARKEPPAPLPREDQPAKGEAPEPSVEAPPAQPAPEDAPAEPPAQPALLPREDEPTEPPPLQPAPLPQEDAPAEAGPPGQSVQPPPAQPVPLLTYDEWQNKWEHKLISFRIEHPDEEKDINGYLDGYNHLLPFLQLLEASFPSFYPLIDVSAHTLARQISSAEAKGRRFTGGWFHVKDVPTATKPNHFTFLLIDRETNTAEYFDSCGVDTAVLTWIEKRFGCKVVSATTCHQSEGKECLVYCCYFVKERLLRETYGVPYGTSFAEFEAVPIPPGLMLIERNRLFPPASRPGQLPPPFLSPFEARARAGARARAASIVQRAWRRFRNQAQPQPPLPPPPPPISQALSPAPGVVPLDTPNPETLTPGPSQPSPTIERVTKAASPLPDRGPVPDAPDPSQPNPTLDRVAPCPSQPSPTLKRSLRLRERVAQADSPSPPSAPSPPTQSPDRGPVPADAPAPSQLSPTAKLLRSLETDSETLYDAGEYAAAELGYRDAIFLLLPSSPCAELADRYTDLGLALFNQGRFFAAEAPFRSSLQEKERLSLVGENDHYNLANTLAMKAFGLTSEARRQTLEEALSEARSELNLVKPAAVEDLDVDDNAVTLADEICRRLEPVEEGHTSCDVICKKTWGVLFKKAEAKVRAKGKRKRADNAPKIRCVCGDCGGRDAAVSLEGFAEHAGCGGDWRETVLRNLPTSTQKLNDDREDRETEGEEQENEGDALLKQGRFEEALGCYEKVLKEVGVRKGPCDLEIALALSDVGVCLYNLDRDREAELFQRRALEITEQELGMEHEETGRAAANLARSLRVLGQKEEAMHLFHRALDVRELLARTQEGGVEAQIEGGAVDPGVTKARERSLELAEALEDVGESLNSLGRGLQGAPYRKRCLVIKQEEPGIEDVTTADLLALHSTMESSLSARMRHAKEPRTPSATKLSKSRSHIECMTRLDVICHPSSASQPSTREAKTGRMYFDKQDPNVTPLVICNCRECGRNPCRTGEGGEPAEGETPEAPGDAVVVTFAETVEIVEVEKVAREWQRRTVEKPGKGELDIEVEMLSEVV
ncbi:hypothetical protein KFL_007080050 [Klebsormidium nitens]|uniref:Uncharacterized protein n=1 Tax=Klebsormidium nitens TaxID=105231 RepID=A0A1Y1IQR5_KLENI|nr:hypothetical protein KFL_007080050 [Klebsormidium nitens]|eukprot:GAQ90967.1 hypothetical protein KFL_007080050 [Klebsormidium nitens]